MAWRVRTFLAERIWEPVRLARAAERARAYAPEQQQRVRAFAAAARARLRVARDLRDEDGQIAALTLLKDAARLGIAGAAAAAGAYDSSATPDPEQAQRLLETEFASRGDVDVPRLKALISTSEPLDHDRMPIDERRALQATLEHAVRRIVDGYETRTLPELRVQRVLRATLVLVSLVALVFGGVTIASLSERDAHDALGVDASKLGAPAAKPRRPRRKE